MLAKLIFYASVLLSAPAPEAEPKPDQVAPLKTAETRKDEKTSVAAATAEDRSAVKTAEGTKEFDLLSIEANIISYTNAERAKRGLPELEMDRTLMISARRHCAWMARHRSLVHTTQPVGENIAMGQPHSREAVRDWMTSPGHRANILHRGYRRIGVAAYRTSTGTIYWCQQFLR